MITIYAEKEIFEDIISFNDQYPNLYKIFTKHAVVCLNMTNSDLDNEELEGTIVFEYIKSTGGRSPIALKEYFEDIYENNKIIADKPRSVFFLNCSKEKAKQMQDDYGVIVQSKDALNDKILSGPFKKELKKSSKYKNGWQTLLDFEKPPCNSIVISDLYLLLDLVNNNYYGKDNVIELIDALLPVDLKAEFNLTIISSYKNNFDLNKKPTVEIKVEMQKIEDEIKCKINKMRNYDIKVEIFWIENNRINSEKIEGLHKRRLLCNYVNASTHYGFSVFKKEKGELVIRKDNELIFNRVYCDLDNFSGDTEFDSLTIGLEMIKNTVQLSNNRLINDV